MAANLPDVFLLSVFKRLDANDRLTASRVCLNWFHRVREVNGSIKCLTILDGDKSFTDSFSPNLIEQFTKGYHPVVERALMSETKKENAGQKKLYRSTKQNTLTFSSDFTGKQNLNSTIVQQIITAFSSTTELNFISNSENQHQFKYLAELLEFDQNFNNPLSQQLTALRIIDSQRVLASILSNIRFYNAIDRLPVLEKLTVDLNNNNKPGFILPHLSIFARLKEIRLMNGCELDLMWLYHQVARNSDNAEIRIDLPDSLKVVRSLNQSPPKSITVDTKVNDYVRKKISCIAGFINTLSDLEYICANFPNLYSLSIECNSRADSTQMFTLVSRHLLNLHFLEVYVDFQQIKSRNVALVFVNDDPADNFGNGEFELNVQVNIPPLTSPPLFSVKVVQLSVTLTSHSDLQWLNLSETLPNLKAIHFSVYNCLKCDVHSCNFDDDGFSGTLQLKQQPIWPCFEAVVSQLAEITALTLDQITLCVGLKGSVISGHGIFEF